ncbi:MAG: Uma2 family endonuclease [Selenomonadaceae bacterium]|nr:Uma2 family endonuclease [Selenomonadaceae bacterium]
MLNDALFYESYEIIEGEKIMSPSPDAFHNRTLFRLGIIIGQYTIENNCGYVFTDNLDVHLPDGNLFRPDLVVVKSDNEKIIHWDGTIYGVPDMVVEVLSRATRRKDLTIKKDIYESNGVKEYWIIDPWAKAVDVYILREGKFELEGEYFKYSATAWRELSDEEKAAVKSEIKVGIFEDCVVKVADIFSWGYEE